MKASVIMVWRSVVFLEMYMIRSDLCRGSNGHDYCDLWSPKSIFPEILHFKASNIIIHGASNIQPKLFV